MAAVARDAVAHRALERAETPAADAVLSIGVMLVDTTVPNGVSTARPPANAVPPSAVWQCTQLPSPASWPPRAITTRPYKPALAQLHTGRSPAASRQLAPNSLTVAVASASGGEQALRARCGSPRALGHDGHSAVRWRGWRWHAVDRGAHHLRRERRLAKAHAGGIEDRIRDRRGAGHRRRFARAERRLTGARASCSTSITGTSRKLMIG